MLLAADMLGVIRATDLMIADVSSVSLDHLYLRPDAPLVLCDRRTDRARLLEDAPSPRGRTSSTTRPSARSRRTWRRCSPTTPCGRRRHELRDFYFDSLAPGQSTERFWAEVHRAIHDHDSALRELSRLRIVEETA